MYGGTAAIQNTPPHYSFILPLFSWVILALGILGILAPMASEGTEGPRTGRRLGYDGIQGLLEGDAMGIEKKQSAMKEMDKNMSIKKIKLAELEKTVQRRQRLLDLTNREIEEGLQKLEVERERRETGERKGSSGGVSCLRRGSNHPREPSSRGGQDIWAAGHGCVCPMRPSGDPGLGQSQFYRSLCDRNFDDHIGKNLLI